MFDIKEGIAAYINATDDGKRGWICLIYEWALIQVCRHISKFGVDFSFGNIRFNYNSKDEKGLNGIHRFHFDKYQNEITVHTYTGREHDKIKVFSFEEIEQAIELFIKPAKDGAKHS